ncbi:MAG: hypothetical protein AB8B55_08870 [Mariniblastus sp.]
MRFSPFFHSKQLLVICSSLALLALLPFSQAISFAQETTFGQSPAQLTASLPTKEQRSPAASFKVSLKSKSDDKGTATLVVEAIIADGWHIYPTDAGAINTPTKIVFKCSNLKPVGDFELLGDKHADGYLEGKFKWKRQYKITDATQAMSGSGSISFQVCDELKCLPPQTLEFELGELDASAAETDAKMAIAGDDTDLIKLKTETCKTTRPPATFSMGALLFGQRDEVLNRKCSIEVQGKKMDIYLPRAREYPIENTAVDNTVVSNTATYISVDQNGDGVLESHEAMPTNLPIRILDSMYRVADIAKDGSSISLTKSDGPLFGVVLNRKCPEFSFQSLDGQTISDTSILGKVTLLDIWAVT